MILSIGVYALCGIGLVLSALIARRADPEATVAELFDRILSSRTTSIAVIVCWWWLGWHFLVAQTIDPGA
ncbi:DUF6186 family protein [Microbacterium sp. X-17]|uniref:DUF6186 family protein n=1 Tax=Microbacterium sp. X-17 TaxID=3144404 RepID=UPI0031F54B02